MPGDGSYHHGDLPNALMAAVEEVIREAGVGAVSLREVARRVGVTHSAPAHHFRDKAGLLTAFAAEGFRLLGAHMADAVGSRSSEAGTLDFTAVGLAYVEFAVTRPAHFAVMFRPEHVRQDDPEYRRAAIDAFAVVVDAVRAIRDDLDPDDPEVFAAATGAWSTAHGFATLWLDGNVSQLVAHDEARDAAAEAFLAFGATLVRAADRDRAGRGAGGDPATRTRSATG